MGVWGNGRRNWWRAGAAWLALLAIVVRALVPLGWMPNPEGFGQGIPLVICTSDGRTFLLNGDPVAPGEQERTALNDACVFATSAVGSLPQPDFIILTPTSRGERLIAATDQRVAAASQRRLGQPRAPPV